MSVNVIQAVPLVPAAVPEREERLRRAVDEHYAFIWRTLRRFGIPKDEADDLVQEVLLIFARKLETVEMGLEQPFLFRCAANVALHARRAFQRRRALQERAARLDGIEQTGPSVEDEATRQEDLELLDELLAALDARIQTSWVDGSDTRSFDVRGVRRKDGAFVGQLENRQPGRAPNTRTIRGGTCKAVTAALVVFVAIALDPASTAPPTNETLPTGETEPAGETERRPPADRRPTRPARESSLELADVRPPAPTKRSQPIPAAEPRPVWTWSAGVAIAHMRAPPPSWGGRVHAEVARRRERDRIGPALRLSWGWSDFAIAKEQTGEVRFRIKSARVEAGVRGAFEPFLLGVFAGVDVGSLTGIAPDLPRFSAVEAPWTAWAGTARAGVAVARWLALELAATMLVPFERPRFGLEEPRRLVYGAPGIVFEGSGGVIAVARFP